MDCAGCVVGGIFRLGISVAAHTSELYADFRAIYSTPLSHVSGPELFHLLSALLADPTSRFHAAEAGWSNPLSWEGMNDLHLLDLLLQRWSTSFKPFPRPWDAAVLAARVERISDERLMQKLRPQAEGADLG